MATPVTPHGLTVRDIRTKKIRSSTRPAGRTPAGSSWKHLAIPIARKIVKLIAKLYRTETELREHPELERAAYRQKHTAPVLEQIKTILEREQPRQPPQSNFGKALAYTLER